MDSLIFAISVLLLSFGAVPHSDHSRYSRQPIAPASTFSVTNTNDSGPGSLRQAITDANANPGADLITFSIGSGLQTIAPASLLPDITDPVVIDGTTQPGYAGVPLIELSGVNGPSPSNHGLLTITGGNSTIRGLIINHNKDFGISITTAGGNHIEGNYLGTNATGNSTAVSNGNLITITSANNVIGGTTPEARNVISGSTNLGISIFGSSATGNVIQGNYIGTNVSGTAALGSSAGVNITSANNTVGGTSPAARNVISGNNNAGVLLQSPASGNLIQGNYIGTNAAGNAAIPNTNNGISVFDNSTNNTIGGTTLGAGNVISGNGWGISIASASTNPVGTVIQGNYIGVAADGTTPLPNRVEGIRMAGATSTTIGGTTPEAANIIAFNGATAEVGVGTGIEMLGANFSPINNSIRGNAIFSNGRLGIDLDNNGVTPNDVGDTDSGPNNRQNFPVITSVVTNASQTTITGTLNSAANQTYQLDFYANGACDASGNGEGAIPFGVASVATDGSGNGTFSVVVNKPLPTGRVITATATDANGSTSEFSACDASQAAGNVQFVSNTLRVMEDASFATVSVIRSGGSFGTLSVNYVTSDGTATAGQDYVASSGTITFNNGETTKSFDIPITDDAINESDETFNVRLLGGPGPDSIGPLYQEVITIQDHSVPPQLSINSVSVNEGDSGTTNANFTVTLSAQTAATVTVKFSTAGNNATSGTDFQATSGTSTFPPRVLTQTITVPVIGDTIDEFDETFRVVLSSPVGAVVNNGLGTGTIVDNDPPPAASVSDAFVVEGNSSTTFATFTVTLSQPSGKSPCFQAATADGTATVADSDYVPVGGSIMNPPIFGGFAPGAVTTTFIIQVRGDTKIEPDETFLVNLTACGDLTLGRGQGTGTIFNDDTTGNPIDLAAPFVRQHYLDFLNREPDSSGLDFWTRQITSCGSDLTCTEVHRINTSGAFFLSIEFQQTGYLVERFYKVAYGDTAGSSTLNGAHTLSVPIVRLSEFLADTRQIGTGVVVLQPGWEQVLENNKQTFALQFVQRSRFTAANAFPTTMTPDQFVDKLNQNAGNVLSPAERATAIALFGGAADTSNNQPRAQAVRQVAEDTDLFAAESNRAFVLTQYFGYLRRNPNDSPDSDYTGYDFWLTKLNQFNGNYIAAEMVKAFISSDEYRKRFGP